MDRVLWEQKKVEPDRIYRMRAGERDIFAGYTGGEWRIASSLEPGRTELSGWETIEGDLLGEADGFDWTRIIALGPGLSLRAVPAMPDKPLVIRPEHAILLPDGREGLFFVEIPLWARIIGTGKGDGSDETLLAELPLYEISKTWFGNLSVGEMCYITRTRASSEIPSAGTEGPAAAHTTALCPVTAKNFSSSPLEFGRVCIRTEFLSVFEGRNRLWSSPVELVYQGNEEASQTTGTGAPEQLAGEGRLLAPPKAVPDNSIVRKSFSLLKDLAGW